MNEKVTVVIPTYNESENIPELVKRIRGAVKTGVNIFVMDDSPDNRTVDAALAAGCMAVRRTKDRGLSKAVIDGIKRTDSDFIIVMDADLQHPPEVLPKMIEAFKTSDLVVGSRWVPGGGTENWSAKRILISKVANLMALPLVPKIKDRTSGFFGFRKSAIDPDKLNPTGWKIGLEVMALGKYTEAAEVPYMFVPRVKGESKMSGKQMIEYIKQLFTLYMSKFQILNFMVVGGIGYAINMAILAILTTWPPAAIFRVDSSFLEKYRLSPIGRHQYLLPFAISSFVAILSNYTLNKIWTFKGSKERKLGGLRYFAMAAGTLIGDMAFLTLLVDAGKLPYLLAAALAILIVFVVRYIIAKNWVWSEKTAARQKK